MKERELPQGDEFADEEFADEDDGADDVSACAGCGREIYTGADRCPHCGDYRIAHGATGRGWPAWMWIGIVIALGVLVLWALRG